MGFIWICKNHSNNSKIKKDERQNITYRNSIE